MGIWACGLCGQPDAFSSSLNLPPHVCPRLKWDDEPPPPQPEPPGFARCRGRAWPGDDFLAAECQQCRRWVAHATDARLGHGMRVVQIEPTMQDPCPNHVGVVPAGKTGEE
jgi:hypothetical protein